MEIRAAHDEDFDTIAAITNHYIANTAIHFASEPVTAGEMRAQWRGKSFPWLVVVDDGRVAGYAKAGTWRDRAAYRSTVETGLYLDVDARGRRLGTQLYAELIDACRRGDYRTAVAGIALPNEPSVRLHERLGFEHVGVFREVGHKHDCWHDVGFWQLQLAGHDPAR